MSRMEKRKLVGGHSGFRFATRHEEPVDVSRETKSPIHDLREHPRSTAHDLSEIILDGRTYGVACLILDLSDAGAKLEVSCGELPKRFILANYTRQTKTLCRQIWRDNRLVGVKFLTSPRPFRIEERL